MFKLRTRPYAKHQTDAISWLAERERGALLLPMGTGKTYIMLARMSLVDGPTLVVAPLSVLRSWESEIRKHTTATCVVATGTPDERRLAIRADVDFVLINYDYFSRASKKGNAIFMRFVNVILDESTRIKNPRAKRTASIIDIFSKAQRKYILTGTPITRDYSDVFSQWLFMDDGRSLGKNYFKFLRRYYSPISYGAGRRSWEIRSGGPAAIAAKISGSFFHMKRSDCVDLPEKVYERRHYKLTTDQRKVYDATIKEMIAEYDGAERVINNPLARDTLLRQICSGYLGDGDSGILREMPTGKYPLIREIVEDLGEEEQCVIWYTFRPEHKYLEQILKDVPGEITYIDGSVPERDRAKRLSEFAGRRVRIFLAQTQSCAYGINEFAKCRYAIYAGNSYDLDLRAQSEDRSSRKGSTHSCTYIDVVAERSIEEAILQVLATKELMQPRVFRARVLEMIKGWAA